MNSNRLRRAGLMALICVAGGMLRADEPFDFRKHFFLRHLIGKWVTEGELKGADGNVIKLKEEWKAVVEGDNSLVLEGTRELNGNAQHYKWIITRNEATGLFEASHRASDEDPNTQRFEINFSEAEMTMEWSGFLGSGNAKAAIVDRFEGPERDRFKGEVKLTDDNGMTTLSGTLTSTRQK